MSKIVTGKGESKYEIHISTKSLPKQTLNKQINKESKVMIITDSGVPKKYLKELKKIINNKNINIFTIDSGEKSKSFGVYKKIIDELSNLKFSRSDILIACGGGVVGDVNGFCAFTIFRRVKYIQIPTTLLSQVDSSVGGKTAINLPQGKNLIGAFYNPSLVLISTNFLNTLSKDEFNSGLGEVIKYALIGNKKLKKIIENNPKKIINRNQTILKTIIEESIKTKSKIVTQDEKETGIRAILNFGHTFGHAIEAFNRYKNISHGAAITLGMIIASKVSFYEGHISSNQLQNIINIISSLELNTDHTKYNFSHLDKYIKTDKKVSDGKLNLILINKSFNAFKTSKFNKKNILKALG